MSASKNGSIEETIGAVRWHALRIPCTAFHLTLTMRGLQSACEDRDVKFWLESGIKLHNYGLSTIIADKKASFCSSLFGNAGLRYQPHTEEGQNDAGTGCPVG